jgi:hypothetical protein
MPSRRRSPFAPLFLAIPTLSIQIPTVKFSEIDRTGESVTIPWLAQYLVGVYQLGLTVGGAIAVVMMMWGGFLWLSSGGDAGAVKKGKQKIMNAAAGLIVLFGAYVILNVVNPDLNHLKSIEIAKVDQQSLPPFADDGSHGGDGGNSNLPSSEKDKCRFETFGATDKEVLKGIVEVRFPGFTQTVQIHKAAAPAFDAAFREWEAQGPETPAGQYLAKIKEMPFYNGNCSGKGSALGGQYAARLDADMAKGWPTYKDQHAFGNAVDIDSCHNQWVTGTKAQATTVPDDVIAIFKKHDIYWGGYGWAPNGTDPNAVIKRDGMHWEWHGKCW